MRTRADTLTVWKEFEALVASGQVRARWQRSLSLTLLMTAVVTLAGPSTRHLEYLRSSAARVGIRDVRNQA